MAVKSLREILDAKTTERQFQQLVMDYARLRNWACYHTHDSRRSSPGFPDLVLVRDGVMLAWECKRQVGRVTPEQTAWLAALDGVRSVSSKVIRPSDWPELQEVLS